MKRSMRFAAVMMAAVMTVGTASWQWLDGNHDGVAECYYFDQTGYMLNNAKTPDGYQVNADGAWVVNSAVQTKVVNLTWLKPRASQPF